MTNEPKKQTRPEAKWVANLRFLMQVRRLNSRRLSLMAGLNSTAVRDILEGRTQYPRYDTVQSLARVLDVTPTQLMGPTIPDLETATYEASSEDDFELLSEIIACVQDASSQSAHDLPPRDFAALVTTVYRDARRDPPSLQRLQSLKPRVQTLFAYETLRQRSAQK